MRIHWPGLLILFLISAPVVAVSLPRETLGKRNPTSALLSVKLSKMKNPRVFRRDELFSIVKMKWLLNAVLLDKEVACLKSVGLQANPTAWLERHLQVVLLADGNLMISFDKGSPAEQVIIVNAVVKEYLALFKRKAAKFTKFRPKRLEIAKVHLKRELRHLRDAQNKIQTFQARLQQAKDAQDVQVYRECVADGLQDLKKATAKIQRFEAEIREIQMETDEPLVTLLKKAVVPR